MQHPVSGINFLILSVSLASHVSTYLSHLLIHLSTHLYHYHHSHHASLLHSFTPGSKPTFQQILPCTPCTLDFFYLLDAFMITGLDLTYHAHHFNFSFTFYFLFIPCGGLSWLPVSFLCTLNTHYRVVYLNNGFLGRLRTTHHRQDNKRVAKRLWGCVNAEKKQHANTCCNCCLIPQNILLFRQKYWLFKRFTFCVHKAACGMTCSFATVTRFKHNC